MYDISAANLVSVSLQVGGGGFGSSIEFKKRDFSPDISPVRIERASIVSTEIDMNKRLFPSRVYRPIRVSLAPIPNTSTDNRLKDMLLEARQYASDPNWGNVERMVITYASAANEIGGGLSENKLTLEDGFIVDGNLGIEVMPEGRFGSSAYVFEFADIDGKLEVDNSWIEWEQGDGSPNQANPQKKPPKVRINPKKVGAVYYFGSAANQFNR